MARLLRAAVLIACFLYAGKAFAAGGTCPSGANYLDASGQQLVTLSSLGVTECYYVAANGSDSNPGTSESSPWAHLPGMPGCSGGCASTKPGPGTGFILRGGDTWNKANLGVKWTWAGSSSNPIYIGVDANWSASGSWARPIFNCNSSACGSGGDFFSATENYVILDNIEFTGLLETSASHPSYASVCGTNFVVENLYVHGWSHDSSLVNAYVSEGINPCNGGPNTGFVARYNVIDGSDTGRDQLYGIGHGGTVTNAYGNVIRYVATAIDGTGDDWHDNLVEYLVPCPGGSGCHQDGLYQFSGTGNSMYALMYNNVIRNTTWSGSGGAVKFWMSGNGGNSSGYTGYAFNNVIYNNQPGNTVDTGGHFNQNYGIWYFFNNTVECGMDSVPGNCILGDNGNKQGGVFGGGSMSLFLSNNHWIQATDGGVLSCTQSSYHCSETTAVYQTVAQASAQGYSSDSAYAFQPTSASGSTVTSVANAAVVATRQSLCTAIGIVDATAGAACQSDTSYACAYETTSHIVHCPTRQTIARAAEPNVGAYQFSSVEAETPNPPAGLTVSVQ